MMKKLLIILMILIGGELLLVQGSQVNENSTSDNQDSSAYKILDKIEEGISQSNTTIISSYFSPEIYLSLLSSISGYYTSNQAYYVMEDFFKNYKVTAFKFDKVNLDALTPYAVGTYYFDNKGNRSEAKVYITIKQIGITWQITQISIN
jgi:Domain of unknown function (DUF4783)